MFKSARFPSLRGVIALQFAILLLFVGCGPGKVVELDADDNGRLVEVKRGQSMTASLESNPTTGFRWEVIELDEGKLQQVGKAVFEAKSDLVGASGIETFRFKAAGAGETTLELGYHRPWESKPPLEIFSCRVVVR